MEGNCMMGCLHNKTKDITKKVVEKDSNGNVIMVMNEFVGYQHFCDKCPKAYDDWKSRNAKKTYDEYKKDTLPCFEPYDHIETLHKMKELAQDILDNINKKSENI